MQSQILLLCQPCENISPARERRGQEGGWHTKQQHDILQLGALAIEEFVKPHQRIDGVRVAAAASGLGVVLLGYVHPMNSKVCRALERV